MTWRNDAKAQRVIVEPGPANDAVYVGFEAVDDAAFDNVAQRLEAAGFPVRDSCVDERSSRRVRRLAHTLAPWGVRVELVAGLEEAPVAYESPLVPGGFLTSGVGLGHAVFATTAFEESHAFATEGLGMAQSDWLEMEIAEGLELEVRFYHCNPRHHTLALAKAPFELPQRLHHLMVETNSRDDVGAAFDRAWTSGLGIPNGLGQHDNDGMFSFYVASPVGFQVEVGYGARTISDDWDDNRRYDRISTSGPPAAAPTMTRTDSDVIVVGCGPVGMTLAVLLAQRGHSVTILERWSNRYPLPRAVHLDHEVARIFQSAGIGVELAEITEPADVYEWRNGQGTTLLRLGRVGAGASGWPMSLMFHQPALEEVLERRAGALGVDIRRGCEVTDLSQHDHGVAVATNDGDVLEARYAVGCDGANSTVRTLLDVPMTELGFFYDWLIVDVILHDDRVFDPTNVQVCDPARPTTVVSGGPGRRRWEFMRLDHETLDELEASAWELLEPWDVRPDNATVERRAVYTFAARHAEHWRRSRVLLAGDAAHQMPPFAGQGMCAGVRDAANLAWKLDLVLTEAASDALLDTYDQERLPSARNAIEFSIELGKIICIPDPDAATARDEAMAPLVGPEPTHAPSLPGIEGGVTDADSPHAGSLFVQGIAGGRRFDDVHGAGWRLVTIDRKRLALDPETRRWFASIGGCVVTVPADDPVYGRWFSEHDATATLQRPDFHLYGTAASQAETAALVEHLRTRLATQPARQGALL